MRFLDFYVIKKAVFERAEICSLFVLCDDSTKNRGAAGVAKKATNLHWSLCIFHSLFVIKRHKSYSLLSQKPCNITLVLRLGRHN